MSTDTLTLTDFLLAQIAEDETCPGCKHPVERHYGRWCRVVTGAVVDAHERICCCGLVDSRDRVLAECAAKRRIVELCRADHEDSMSTGDDTTELASEVLRALASVYADHADYRPEWA